MLINVSLQYDKNLSKKFYLRYNYTNHITPIFFLIQASIKLNFTHFCVFINLYRIYLMFSLAQFREELNSVLILFFFHYNLDINKNFIETKSDYVLFFN